MLFSMLPGAGEGSDIVGCAGYDPVTIQEVSGWERGATCASIPLPFVGGAVIRKVFSKGSDELVEGLAKNVPEVPVGNQADVVKAGKRFPINCRFAGCDFPLSPELAKKYPAGLKFKSTGYPDFSPYSVKTVDIGHLTTRPDDFKRANQMAGLSDTPDGYTWHHVENSSTLQLVPRDLHEYARHTGGVATSK